MSEAAIKKFKEKLGALEKETGCSIEIVYPKFFEAVEANRLFADWFEPDTVIARAVKGDAVITYDIVGELDAQLVNSSGDIVRTFSGKFTPYNKALILIDDDRNLSTLNDGTDPSGCVLRFAGNNHLRISSSNESVEPIIAPEPSVARGILNRGFLEELFTATEDANFRDAGRLPIAESRARFDERIEGKVYSLDDEIPDKPISDEGLNDSDVISFMPRDIPEYEEYMEEKGKEKTDAEAALELAKQAIEDEAKEAQEKPAKKTAKKKTAKEKESAKAAKQEKAKPEKKEVPAKAEPVKEEPVKEEPAKAEPVNEEAPEIVRFDLLPLDLVGEFIEMFDKEADDIGFLALIEAYKKGQVSLLSAAVTYAKANYGDAIDAVTVLAKAFEADAAANGEGAWAEGDVIVYLNSAIKEYLMSLRGQNNGKAAENILGNLFRGAWVSENK